MELEKIRPVKVSTTPIPNTDTVCLRLIIPSHIVDKLNIEPTKKCGKQPILYITPPIDQIKKDESFDLIYRFLPTINAIPDEQQVKEEVDDDIGAEIFEDLDELDL